MDTSWRPVWGDPGLFAESEAQGQTKARIGKQRGAKVAQIDLARRLSEAIWHMLTRSEGFAPKGATDPLAA